MKLRERQNGVAVTGSPRNRYRRHILIFIGYQFNTLLYLVYFFSVFKSVEYALNYLLKIYQVQLLIEQREILFAVLTLLLLSLWMKYFSQGYEGDAFSHVLYWQYRLINKAEMISRVLGVLTAGLLFGFLYSGILGFETKPVSLNDDLAGSIFNGCLENKTYTEMFVKPLLSDEILYKASRFICEGNTVPKWLIGGVTDPTNVVRYVSALFDTFIFEFCFSVAIYIALSVYVVVDGLCNFVGVYCLLKRFAVITANSYLRNINGAVCLDAAVSMRRYFQDRNQLLLLVRVLANFLAVIITARFFNPTLSLPYNNFRQIYSNVHPSKMEAMNPGRDVTMCVSSTVLEDQDIEFSRFPDTNLGRFLRCYYNLPDKVKMQ